LGSLERRRFNHSAVKCSYSTCQVLCWIFAWGWYRNWSQRFSHDWRRSGW